MIFTHTSTIMPSQKRRLSQLESERQKVAKKNASITAFFNTPTRSDESRDLPAVPEPVCQTDPPVQATKETDGSTAARIRQNSGHKVGVNKSWMTIFSWLIFTTETDESGNTFDVMLCKLCKKHSSYGYNGNKTWAEIGYRCLRRDKVKEHQDSDQHKHALSLELNYTINDMSTKMTSSAQAAIMDALKVMYFIITKNLPLDLFSSMIDLCIEVGANNLPNLRKAKNATYSSWETTQQLLDLLSQQVSDTVMTDVRASPCYSLMVDEVSDNRSIKHLALCTRYINPGGQLQTAFLTDTELPNATAETVTNSIVTEINKKQLLLSDMTGFASDGAAVFVGKKTGVAKQLKDSNQSLITIHCRDHRLALACRDSFNSIPVMKKTDEILEKLYKYYKYSCNHTASLKNVQAAFNTAPLSIKQAKHHRWLSHDQAVSSVVRSYKAIIVDLETSGISSDPVGNGILKSLKDPTTLRSLLLLADTLPHVTALSLVFQRRDVNLGMVKNSVTKTIKMIENRKTQDGPWQLKYPHLSTEIQLPTTSSTEFQKDVKDPFLNQLVVNIQERFTDIDIIDQLSVLDLNGTTEELPALYGFSEMCNIADHFSIDQEDMQTQWQDFIQLLNSMPEQDRSLEQLLKLLHNSDTGLQNIYPLVFKLISITTTLPLSTAEVERVFSQVKLIKTSHRSSLKTDTLNRLLNVKMNCDKALFQKLLEPTVAQFFKTKDRRLNSVCHS